MQITGAYSNYLTMTHLLAPLGVGNAGQVIMQVFSSAMEALQDKVDQEIFSKESESAIKALYQKVSTLADDARVLTLNDSQSVFYDRTAFSSDPDVLKATAINAFSANSGATVATYAVSVNQLAQTQRNVSTELTSQDQSIINQGTNTFTLTIQGQDYTLSIDILEGDTNEDALQKIMQAINEEGLGVTAEVLDNSETGTQKLVITSQNSGAENAFEITDNIGNMVSAIRMDIIETTAQDAQYNVNGSEYSSDTNTVYLDDGLVIVNLRAIGQANLKIAPNNTNVINAVANLVSELNAFMSFLDNQSGYIDDKVLSTVNAFISKHETTLASLGIVTNEDGKLEINTDQLATGLDQGMESVKETFAGFDGLAVQLNSFASQIVTGSPLEYAKEAENINMEFADYVYGSSAEMLQTIVRGSLLNAYV